MLSYYELVAKKHFTSLLHITSIFTGVKNSNDSISIIGAKETELQVFLREARDNNLRFLAIEKEISEDKNREHLYKLNGLISIAFDYAIRACVPGLLPSSINSYQYFTRYKNTLKDPAARKQANSCFAYRLAQILGCSYDGVFMEKLEYLRRVKADCNNSEHYMCGRAEAEESAAIFVKSEPTISGKETAAAALSLVINYALPLGFVPPDDDSFEVDLWFCPPKWGARPAELTTTTTTISTQRSGSEADTADSSGYPWQCDLSSP